MATPNVAAIDLGSNSCRLQIVGSDGSLLLRDSAQVRLSEGLAKTNTLTQEAINRGINCLSRFKEIMNTYGVEHYRAIATEACRVADNGKQFIQMVKEMTGITIDIISAQEEAELTLKGAILNADKNKKYVLVYDLGGASTEITLATNENKPKILYTTSIPLGARNGAEKFDILEYDADKTVLLQSEIRKYVRDFMINSEFLMYKTQCCNIATSSTPLRLFSIAKNTEKYCKEYADGLKLSTKEIDSVIAGVLKMNYAELYASPHIGANRAEIFIAACTIFQTIYQTLELDDLTASLKSAQEAIINELRQQWQN
mgnify:CR=1 FL=1